MFSARQKQVRRSLAMGHRCHSLRKSSWKKGMKGNVLHCLLVIICNYSLGGGVKHFLIFTPILGEMIQVDSYFSKGLVQPPRLRYWFFSKEDLMT